MNENVILSLKNISYRYSGENVLDAVSFDVKRGDFLGLIGPNGSGKTTLLRIILGLITPQTGVVSLFGQKVTEFHDWYKIGYVPQKVTQLELRFPITVAEVVTLGRVARVGLFHRLNQRDLQIVEEALEEVDLSRYKTAVLAELSGGEQQRVFIAKALASEPELLILDEPTVGVDVEAQDRFYQQLLRLNKTKGLTLILVSHDIDVVVNEVNKLACLNKRLIYHGGPKEFIRGNYLSKLYGKSRRFIIHGH